jgi:hypothetical protein
MAKAVPIDSSDCKFLKDIKFRNGKDTLEFDILYWANSPANQQYPLQVLADKNEIHLDEYLDKNSQGITLEFIPLSCKRKFQATLSRKIYDHTYAIKSKHIEDYNRDYVDLNNLKESQMLHIKCIVFEDVAARNRHGGYFFTIIELKLLAQKP